jgi:CO/xanthine dehydrogenase FAD-binding subunit
MPIAHVFDYRRPTTLDEAIELLGPDSGKVRVLAGGTDLVAWLRDDMVAPDLVVDIKAIEDLHHTSVDDGRATIGALATFSELLESGAISKHLPLIGEMAATVGSTGIRHRATLVGNICSAVPCCDGGPVLLAYEAMVQVVGRNGARGVPIAEWFRGPRQTALEGGEIVTGVTISVPEGGHGGAYPRLSRYRGEDLAQASVAIVVTPGHHYRVAFGAVAPTPVRATRIEAVLEGNPLSPELIGAAVSLVPEEISPITDMRAGREYRLAMSEVMLRRGLSAAVERLEGAGPAYGTRLM